MKLTLKQRFDSAVRPLAYLQAFLKASFSVVKSAVLSLDFSLLLSPTRLRDTSFISFYRQISPGCAEYESTTCVPTLLAQAHGTVLEIGPGCGSQLQHYDFSRITKLIALEPNEAFQVDLRNKAKKLGVEAKYVVDPAKGGIEFWLEDWERRHAGGKVSEERLDCVVCMQVLCSLPTDLVERCMRDVWKALDPGGEFIFWEHVANEDFVTRKIQECWNLIWPLFMDGCQLTRKTHEAILKAGDWEVVELVHEQAPENLLPRVWGRLRKKQN